jgi:hypothetical protein
MGMKIPGRRSPDQKLARILGTDAKYVHIGVELGRQVTQAVSELSLPDIETAYDKMLASLERQERAAQLAIVFDRLPASTRFAILEQRLGDEEMKAVLAAKRDEAIKQDERAAAVRTIAETARLHHYVDLSLIPADVRLDFYLFNKDRVESPYYGGDHPSRLEDPNISKYGRLLSFTSMGSSQFKLMRDLSLYQGGRARPAIEPQQIIGLLGVTKPDYIPDPILHYGDQLAAEIDGIQTTIDHAYRGKGEEFIPYREYVGLLTIEGTQMFGSNIE